MSTPLSFMQSFYALTKSNPMLSGAIGIWIGGILTWALRSVPNQLGRTIFKACTSTIMLNNSTSEFEREFKEFNIWVKDKTLLALSREFFFKGDYGLEEGILVPGYGTHFFFYKKRFFWVVNSRLASTGTEKEKMESVIYCLTRSKKVMEDLTKAFRWRYAKDLSYVHTNEGYNFAAAVGAPKRPLSTIVTRDTTKEDIVKLIEEFYASESWYRLRGIPYKLVILLYGVPGTGKTSLIKSIAGHFDRSVYAVNLNTCSDTMFPKLMTMAYGGIVAIEDFDSCPATHKNGAQVKIPAVHNPDSDAITTYDPYGKESVRSLFDDGVSLTTILNTLDGVQELNRTVIFLTTNRKEIIADNILRDGRCDHQFEILPLDDEAIRRYIDLVFPGCVVPEGAVFEDCPGSTLQAKFMKHRNDPAAFIGELVTKGST
jgi:chaperone BCS1